MQNQKEAENIGAASTAEQQMIYRATDAHVGFVLKSLASAELCAHPELYYWPFVSDVYRPTAAMPDSLGLLTDIWQQNKTYHRK